MSLKNRFFSTTAVALSIAAFSIMSFAQDATTTSPNSGKAEKTMRGEGRHHGKGKFGHGGMGRHGGKHGGMHMLRGIDLTEAQKAQIKSIMEANKPAGTNREEMKTLRMAKRDGTLTADQQSRLEALRAERKEKGKLVHEQILNVLTADQKAQIEQRKQEFKQRREDRRNKRQQNDADANKVS